MDSGLGYLSLLSPEIRDLIYELIPVEDNPEIASPCQHQELRSTSKSLSRDLHRSSRPCTHIDYTFTCDVSSKEVIEDWYGWLRARLTRSAHAHNLATIHRVEIIIQSSANPESTLCYRLVSLPPDRKVIHIWFDGSCAGHVYLCKFQDQLAGSFETAAICINAIIRMMRRFPSQISDLTANSVVMTANDSMLSDLLRYYAAPQAQEYRGPAGKPALCIIACADPANGSVEHHFHPTARHRLEESPRDGTVIENGCLPNPNEPGLDQFDWQHEFFNCKAEWEGRPQGEDWLSSRWL